MKFDRHTLWGALPVPALMLDPVDRIAELNPAAEQFLNASARQVTGQPVWDVLMVDADLGDTFARLRRDGTAVFVNNVAVSSGSTTPVRCNLQISPIGADGDALILVEPRKLADRLDRGISVKSSAKSAVGMAEMLAHEIKNPLAGISGAAQLLSMGLGSEDRELTDLIVAETRRIVALLEQVEQFGNAGPPSRQAVNIHDILDRARKSAEVGFAAQMQIVRDYDPSLPPTWVDADQMVQVFLNLLKNAAEAAPPEGGTVRLRTFYDLSLRLRRSDGSGNPLALQIEVIDDGPGFPPDLIADAFEPFVSGRESGAGLGLALVSKIVADNDGWIELDSTPGRTVFRLSLPVAPKEEIA